MEKNTVISYEQLAEIFDCEESLADNLITLTKYKGTEAVVFVRPIESHEKKIIIAGTCFAKNDKVTDIVLSDSVTVICDGAFCGCKKLANVTLSNNLSYLGNDLWDDDCENLAAVLYENGYYWGSEENPYLALMASNYDQVGTNFEIHDNAKFITSYALYYIKELTTVKIPKGLIGIGKEAFANTAIKQIDLGDSLKYVCDGAFSFCEQLNSISIPDSIEFIGKGVLDATLSLRYNCVAGVNYLGNDKCSYVVLVSVNKEKESLAIKSTTRVIYEEAFRRSGAIKKVTFPGELRSIGEGAFSSCDLKEAVLGEGLVYIGARAFNDCIYLKSVFLPQSLRYIGEKAFGDCEDISQAVFVDTRGWQTDGKEIDVSDAQKIARKLAYNGNEKAWIKK